jgi:FkbM family methyltransferase
MRALWRRLWKAAPLRRRVLMAVRAIWTPPKSIWRHLWFRGEFAGQTPLGTLRMTNWDSYLETAVFWRGLGGYEPESMKLWIELAKNSSVILDIGANTGLYALVASLANPSGQVLAFEPVPRIYELLCRNVRINGFAIHCYPLALSNTEGPDVIFDPPDSHRHASLDYDEACHATTSEPRTIPVTRTTLLRFAQQHQLTSIDLMKIDVEGHEPQVLQGMGELLARMRPAILPEVKSDQKAAEIEGLIQNMGYLVFDIDETYGPHRLEQLKASSTLNVLLCPEEAAPKVGLA